MIHSFMDREYRPEDAESLVDRFIQILYSPQFPSMRADLYFATDQQRTDAERLLKVAEVKFTHRCSWNSYSTDIGQFNVHRIVLEKNREFFIDLFHRLIAMGVVQGTEANYFS